MANNVLRYDRMVEDALRGVLREALKASVDGLPGDHHFYITFRTRNPDVDIPDYMRARYPDEMTIVLQHQYWGLEITPEWFEVTLSFNRVNERLHIPFAAVPHPGGEIEEQDEEPETVQLGEEEEASTPTPPNEHGAQVIALDAFRKK